MGKKSEFQPHKDALPSLKCGSSFWGDWTSDDVETMENDDRLYLAAQKGTISWETGTVDDVETMIILNLVARK